MNGYVGAVSNLMKDVAEGILDTGAAESSSLHLGLLLQDEHFAAGLANADLDAEDVLAMPASSWVWYLRWRSSRAPAPSRSFLNALYDASANPVIRRGIVEAVLNSLDRAHSSELIGVDSPWENWIWRQFVAEREPFHDETEYGRDAQQDGSARALEVASHLLEIGTDRSIRLVGQILRSGPPSRDRLVGLIYEQVSNLESDDETRISWLRRLNISESERGVSQSGEEDA